jgi:glycosyltransferase involved in cell wall biosynthesis
MRILIVTRARNGRISPFVEEQVDLLANSEVNVSLFKIEGSGLWSYLRSVHKYLLQVRRVQPDVIHAHYGISGLFARAALYRKLIITFHGSDINIWWVRVISVIAGVFADKLFYVNNQFSHILPFKKYSVIPCGVNLEVFKPLVQSSSKSDHIDILFGASFDNPVKNAALAKAAVELIPNATLGQLVGLNRHEVYQRINSADICLMTSFSEGSPQFIKEAMACNKPVVSTDVGDVKELFGDLPGYYVCKSEKMDVKHALIRALKCFEEDIVLEGRERIISRGLSNDKILEKMLIEYKKLNREAL